MKKRLCVCGAAVLLAALLAMSGVAQSAMWVGAELGGNFNSARLSADVGNASGSANVFIRPSVIGGAIIGYDFVNSGFGGANFPSWMQYFSVATDITYNRLVTQQNLGGAFSTNSRVNGYEVAWTFLFMAHYGFLRDSEVPTGRINPYIGVGPAILFTGADFSVPVPRRLYVNGRTGSSFGTNNVNVGLVVEPGIRWMCMKNVSVDTAFRYRYAVPSWSSDDATLKLTLHQFAFFVRANYHF